MFTRMLSFAGAAALALAIATPAQAQSKDIVDTAVAAGSFKTLAKLLTDAGLVETLKGAGPFTVFAPTDEAFAKVPKATLDALAADKEKLKAVLQRPVSVEGKTHGDWVLVDGGDVIVHLFRPEVREFYGLEKMWGAVLDAPEAAVAAGA